MKDEDSITANVKRILENLPPDVILVAAAKARTIREVEKAIRAGVTYVGHKLCPGGRTDDPAHH